jgi:site-specific DNA-cytosine methylase
MKYLSLFSGIGGFELGIQQAYEDNNRQTPNNKGGSAEVLSERMPNTERNDACIGYSEIDKYAIQVYNKQFPNHKNYGDITKINAKELPDFDLLCGGFPLPSVLYCRKTKRI